MLRFPPHLIRSVPLIVAAAALACSGDNLSEPTTGSVQVTAATSGADPDPDGYTITVDGTDRGTLAVSGTLTVEGLAAGDHLVGLSGVAGNCQVQGENPRTSSVTTGATAIAAFTVTCTALPPNSGSLQITTATGGSNPDPDGYTVALDGGTTQPIASNVTLTISGIAAGAHTVALGGVAPNCGVGGQNPITITVTTGQTASVDFTISCTVPGTSRIAFISDQGDVRDVYVGIPDGSGSRNLTNGAAGQADTPQWSPDGSKIAFEGGPGGGDIYVINADGTGLLNLTDTPPLQGLETGPVWSPDGITIAFTKAVLTEPDGDTFETNVYTIRADRSGTTQLTTSGQESASGGLSWSPDGSRIAFTSERGTSSQIWVMSSSGTGQIPLTSRGTSFGPQWSPTEDKIAFLSMEGGPPEIWVMNADGTNSTQLTSEPGDRKADVRWSRDGHKIAYTFGYSPSGSGSDIWTMNADGSGKLNVTNNRLDNTSPVWSPNGSQVAFASGSGADAEVRVVNADGSGPQTKVSQAQGYRPDWSR